MVVVAVAEERMSNVEQGMSNDEGKRKSIEHGAIEERNELISISVSSVKTAKRKSSRIS
jgi:hypothetical protein